MSLSEVHCGWCLLRLPLHPPSSDHQDDTGDQDGHQDRYDDEWDDGSSVAGEIETDTDVDETKSHSQGPKDAVSDHEFGGLAGLAVYNMTR